jgi:maleylacetoacetate isomerase
VGIGAFLSQGSGIGQGRVGRLSCQRTGVPGSGLSSQAAKILPKGPSMKLYNYFRSSASFRVRIALNLKGLAYEYLPVHLAKGDHKKEAYTAVSADQLVPMLELDDGTRLSQSMAIIEYLDETQPGAALLPKDAMGRARVRALAQSIACEIHPLNNLRVLKYLSKDIGVSEDVKNTWYRHWVRDGLESFERQLLAQSKHSARRWGCQLPPIVMAIRPRWPTAAWCRRSSTASAST